MIPIGTFLAYPAMLAAVDARLMIVDLLVIKVTETAAATADVIATVAVTMAIEAAERASMDTVGVAATPTVQKPAAMEIAQAALAEAMTTKIRSAAVVKKENKEYSVWFAAATKDT